MTKLLSNNLLGHFSKNSTNRILASRVCSLFFSAVLCFLHSTNADKIIYARLAYLKRVWTKNENLIKWDWGRVAFGMELTKKKTNKIRFKKSRKLVITRM